MPATLNTALGIGIHHGSHAIRNRFPRMQRLQAEVSSDGRLGHAQEGRVRDLQDEVLLRTPQEVAHLGGPQLADN